MQANDNQFKNVVSLDAKRDQKLADKSPFGPIQSGQVKIKKKND